MPRREWSRPFGEVKEAIMGAVRARGSLSSDELVAETGLPFEDVISALRLLRRGGEIEFDPVWAGPDEMSGAQHVRLASSGGQQATTE